MRAKQYASKTSSIRSNMTLSIVPQRAHVSIVSAAGCVGNVFEWRLLLNVEPTHSISISFPAIYGKAKLNHRVLDVLINKRARYLERSGKGSGSMRNCGTVELSVEAIREWKLRARE